MFAAHPTKLAPAIPASPGVVQSLQHSCRTVACEVWSKLDQHCPTLGQALASFDQHWPASRNIRGFGSKLPRCWRLPSSGRSWQTFGRCSPKFGRCSANCVRTLRKQQRARERGREVAEEREGSERGEEREGRSVGWMDGWMGGVQVRTLLLLVWPARLARLGHCLRAGGGRHPKDAYYVRGVHMCSQPLASSSGPVGAASNG